jgi:hypothetical protein
MAKRGPKAKFRPIPPATPGGMYRLYYPGRGVISLDTSDEREAYTKAGQLAQEYNDTPVPTKMNTSDAPQIQQPTFSPPSASEVLSQWERSSPTPITLSGDSSSNGPSPPQSVASPSRSISSPTSAVTSLVPTTQEKVNAALPPEKRAQIAALIAKGATLINIAGTAACVRVLGRIPELDDTDEAKGVLQTGWELQLESWFVEHPPEPWMVIAGGTLAMGIGMYANGTPAPKKDKKPRPPGTQSVDDAINGEPS